MRGERLKGFPPDLLRRAQRVLALLDRARLLDELRYPPGNRLESLRGDREGQYSLRLNDQWRLCFVWQDGDAYEVGIVDYHRPREARMAESIRREDFDRIDLSDIVEPGAGRTPPVHAGEILAEEFMVPPGISAHALALALRVPANRITAIINGTRGITADTALRLATYFGTTPQFWLNLQQGYELELAERASGDRIRREVLPRDHATAD